MQKILELILVLLCAGGKHYQETGKVAYKKLQRNPGRSNSLTTEHEQYIQQIVEKVSQLCTDDIIVSRKSQFEDLKISKSQMTTTWEITCSFQ